jgi:hypothetical protein
VCLSDKIRQVTPRRQSHQSVMRSFRLRDACPRLNRGGHAKEYQIPGKLFGPMWTILLIAFLTDNVHAIPFTTYGPFSLRSLDSLDPPAVDDETLIGDA